MGSLFSSSGSGEKKKSNKSSSQSPAKASSVTDKDRAILDLKNARDKIKKYRKKMDADAQKLTEQAKQLIAQKQRDRALLILKLKRMKEKEVDRADGELLTILETIDRVEWESINLDAMKALKAGTAALNKMHEEMTPDDVAALLDETNEAIEVENQINSLLAGQLDTFDNAELEKELAELMGESVPAAAPATAAPAAAKQAPELVLPDVPSHPVVHVPAAPAAVSAEEEAETEDRVLLEA